MTVKESAALISMVASLALAVAKLVLGVWIGSLALITDAFHSGADFLATIATWLAVRFGDRPPDASHPYGHGKFENIAALGEATLLLLLSGGVMVEAVVRLQENRPPPAFSAIALAVLLGEIAINAWRARALRRIGRETGSAALEADALNFSSDILSSLAVIAGFGLIALGYRWGDAAAAIAVALIVLLLALRLLLRTIDALVDRAPEGLAERVRERILDVAGVLGAAAVRHRAVAPKHFVEATAEIPRLLGPEQADEVRTAVIAATRTLLPGAEVTVQLVPVTPSNETVHERVQLVAAREGVAVHHITAQHLKDRLALALDLEVDGELPLAAAHRIADRLEASIRREFGASTEIETHIEPLEPEATEIAEASEALRRSYIALLEDVARPLAGLSDIHDVRVRRSDRGYVLVAHCRLDPAATVESVHRRVDDLERVLRDRDPAIARIVIHAEPDTR
jgi:cation diffusion facilitator family transporter